MMARINWLEGSAEGEISDLSLSQPAGSNQQLDNWRNTWRIRLGRFFFDLRMDNCPPPTTGIFLAGRDMEFRLSPMLTNA